ncbi:MULTISPECIES: hypothetical protein [unclassified Aureimonas]|uniref:hypothetical protein n=1 Tax=unclassified Aureimonas TaxID=2615206 RepID=UPI0006FE0324|nr:MULTISPECIES: hypothetical protein [unclassified Aureimonas]
MPTATRTTRIFDRSSIVAYAGAGAAIAFIAAMTFGAIDAPSEHGHWVAERNAPEATQMVSATPSADGAQIR